MRISRPRRQVKLLALCLMLCVGLLAIKGPTGQLHHLDTQQTLITQQASHCPHSAPAQTQCQTQQAALMNAFHADTQTIHRELFILLLFVLTLSAFKQAIIDPLDKPPKFAY